MNQATLFDQSAGPLTERQRFARYDHDHPEVWEYFVRFATEARNAGRSRYSARAIIHRIRWECAVERADREPFKINDHLAGRYARKLVDSDPATWSGFFEFRQSME